MGQVLFSGGGGNGVYSEDCTATANDILKGKNALFNGSDDDIGVGTLELTGTAVDNQVIAGKTYYSTDAHTKRTGTIQSQPGWTPIPSTIQQTLNCKGKYMTENVVIPAFVMPSADVIKKGTTISIYGQSITGTWEGYVPTTEYFWKATPGGNSNVGSLVGTGSLGFGDLGQIWSGPGDNNYLTTPSAVNLRKYNKLIVRINKTAGRDYGGVNIIALYSKGGSRSLATWRTDSADGEEFSLEYDASLMATLKLRFTYEGTGLWIWKLENS